MKKLQITIAFLFFIITVESQTKLTIGDKLPGIQINNIINFLTTSLNTTQLKGKILILDFWSTWCSSCITSMPKLAALQQKYNDKIQILLVTSEDSLKVQRLYKRLEYLKRIDLPIVLKDSTLINVFPHEGLPHVVWINKEQEISAITSGEHLIEKNLHAFIQNDHISLPEKRDIPFDSEETLYKIINTEKQIIFSSVFIKGIEGLPAHVGLRKLDYGRIMIQATNALPVSLYAFAYKRKIRLNPNDFETKILIEAKKRDLFSVPNTGREYVEASYCYELIFQQADSIFKEDDYLEQMQGDLDKFFRVKTAVEKRKIPCYILEPSNAIRDTILGTEFEKEDSKNIELHNQPVQKVIPILSSYCNLLHPLLFEGAPEKKINIKIKKEAISFDELRELLLSSGFKISIQDRQMDILCISDQ